jgi:hypothetical protein
VDELEPNDSPLLASKLTILVPAPATLALPAFRSARKLFVDVTRGVRENVLREEKRLDCEKALVTDQSGHVRAFTEFGGSDDSFAEIRYFFDIDGKLRLLFYLRNDVEHGSFQDLVAFDSSNDVSACKHVTLHTGLPAPDLCVDEHPEPQVDPEVKAALQSSGRHRPQNQFREALQAVDPYAAFHGCAD